MLKFLFLSVIIFSSSCFSKCFVIFSNASGELKAVKVSNIELAKRYNSKIIDKKIKYYLKDSNTPVRTFRCDIWGQILALHKKGCVPEWGYGDRDFCDPLVEKIEKKFKVSNKELREIIKTHQLLIQHHKITKESSDYFMKGY